MKEEKNLDDVQVYEIGFHIIPSIPEEKVGEVVTKLKDVLEANNSSVISEEFPVSRPLAYTITKEVDGENRKFNKAYFGWVKFSAPIPSIAAIEKAFKAEVAVLRFLVIKTVKENTMQTPKAPYMSDEANREKEEMTPLIPKEKVEISEEAIDKSIEDLVIN